jgi:hypothetical protein
MIRGARWGMLVAVNWLRLAASAAAATLGTALLIVACSSPNTPACGFPTLGETAEDGGPDPCHCDPPPSLDLGACPCLSGNSQDVAVYNGCMALYRLEMDAGAD